MPNKKDDSLSIPVSDRLWNADFLKIGLIAALFSLAYQMFYTAFPLYLGSLGASSTLIGAATGGFTVASFLVRPVAGHFLDSKGRRIVLLIGMTVTLICSIGLAAIPSIAIILVFRVLQGTGVATVSTANGTIVSDVLPQKRLAEGLGYYGIFFTIATAFGPALALSLVGKNNYTPVLLTNVGLVAITLILAFTVTYEKKRMKAAKGNSAEKSAAPDASAAAKSPSLQSDTIAEKLPAAEYKGIWRFIEKTSLLPAMISAMLSLSSAAAMTFLVPFAKSRGFESIAIFFTVQAIAALFVRFFGGRLSTRFGTLAALLPGLALVGISFLLIAPMNGLPLLVAAAVLHGAGYGLCYPVLNALAILAAPVSRRGAANSTYTLSFDVGIGVGSTIWGIVADTAGYPPAFIAAGLLVFVCFGVSIIVFRNKVRV